jgi:hypothetical protein
MTQVMLHELLEYRDGQLFWKVTRGRQKAGSCAGYIQTNGRRYLRINGKLMLEHRVIWMMQHGEVPEFLDHIDGNPQNNRIENLRPATKQQNAMNRKVHRTNKLRVKGVQKTLSGKFASYIWVNKTNKYLGTFDSPKQANTAYQQAAQKHFKEFASCRS